MTHDSPRPMGSPAADDRIVSSAPIVVPATPPCVAPPRVAGLVWILVGVGGFTLIASVAVVAWHWVDATSRQLETDANDAKKRLDQNRAAARRDKEKDVHRPGPFADEDRIALDDGFFRARGELAADDTRKFVVQLEGNRLYRIDTEGSKIVGSLEISDSTGRLRAREKGDKERAARLLFRPRMTEPFQILLRPRDARAGAFSFEVVDISTNEVENRVQFIDGVFESKGKIAATDPLDPQVRNPREFYLVDLVFNNRYVIDMLSPDFDAYVRVADPKGKEIVAAGVRTKGETAQATFSPPNTGRYHISATSYTGGAGEYRIIIREHKGP